MFASIALNVGNATPVLTVPPRAIFVDNGRRWVYVATAPGHFVRRAVDLLRPGDRVVTAGGLLLREEEEKRTS